MTRQTSPALPAAHVHQLIHTGVRPRERDVLVDPENRLIQPMIKDLMQFEIFGDITVPGPCNLVTE